MKTERPVVGFLGAGNVLGAYLGQLDRLVARGLAEVGPMCAHSPERRCELAARRPALPLVSDLADVVGDPAVDVVVVITLPALHAEHVRLALEAGKHVLCEKPVGEGRAEAEPLYRLAVDRGRLLLAAPFVQLNPTLRALWTAVAGGTAGATWALWFHDGSVGPLAELGIYNLRSLTALLGPVEEIQIAESTAVPTRQVDGERLDEPGHDVQHVILRHAGGALSSLVTGQAIQRYRRPALETTAPRARPTSSATIGIRPGTSSGATAPPTGSRTTRSIRRGCGATACASSSPASARIAHRLPAARTICTCSTSSRRRGSPRASGAPWRSGRNSWRSTSAWPRPASCTTSTTARAPDEQ